MKHLKENTMRGKLRKLTKEDMDFIKANIGRRKDYEVAKVIGIHASQLCRLKERIVKEDIFDIDSEWKKFYGNV